MLPAVSAGTASQQSFCPPAIPALQPIVHDLFVLRGTNKADAGKELETQKEVVVSMLLRLIQYHQVRGPVAVTSSVVPAGAAGRRLLEWVLHWASWGGPEGLRGCLKQLRP